MTNTTVVTKAEAIRRLRTAGFKIEAHQLDAYRDKNGNNWGWDGWFHRS